MGLTGSNNDRNKLPQAIGNLQGLAESQRQFGGTIRTGQLRNQVRQSIPFICTFKG